MAAGIAASAFEPRAAAEKASKAQATQQEGGAMAQLKLYAGAAFACMSETKTRCWCCRLDEPKPKDGKRKWTQSQTHEPGGGLGKGKDCAPAKLSPNTYTNSLAEIGAGRYTRYMWIVVRTSGIGLA